MRRATSIPALIAGLALAWTASASAGIFFHGHGHDHEREYREKPHPTPDPGKKRHFCHTHERAGFPLLERNHAEATNAGDSYGYYVGGGGGGHHVAEGRHINEGTYGWDFTGIHLPRRVMLGWNHGSKYQGGTGAYKTEGPFEVPNIFEIELPKIHHEAEGAEGEHE